MMDVECVILAAGYSSRAETFKPELDIGGKSMIERCMETFYGFCSKIIIVGGYQFERILRIAAEYPKARAVYNERYHEGMFTSVKEGLRHVKGGRVFVCPGDFPVIGVTTCQKMLAAEGDIVVPAFKGKTGHPVVLKYAAAQEILAEPDTSNLWMFIHRKGFVTVDVDDEGILEDVDTPEDYKRVTGKLE